MHARIKTITALNTFLEENLATIRPTDDDQMIWMGDFNHHHPLWEDMRNCHLFNYNTSQLLIDAIADFGMIQLLPQGTPTLQSLSMGNWTHPDNIFRTERILDTMYHAQLPQKQEDQKQTTFQFNLSSTRASQQPQKNPEGTGKTLNGTNSIRH